MCRCSIDCGDTINFNHTDEHYVKIFFDNDKIKTSIKSYKFLLRYGFNVAKIIRCKIGTYVSYYVMKKADGKSIRNIITEHPEYALWAGYAVGSEVKKITTINLSKTTDTHELFGYLKRYISMDDLVMFRNKCKYLCYQHGDPNIDNIFIDLENDNKITFIDYDMFKYSNKPINSPAYEYVRFEYSALRNKSVLLPEKNLLELVHGFKEGYTHYFFSEEEEQILHKWWKAILRITS